MNEEARKDFWARFHAITAVAEDRVTVPPEIRMMVRELGTMLAFAELAWQRGTSVQVELDKFNAEVDARCAGAWVNPQPQG